MKNVYWKLPLANRTLISNTLLEEKKHPQKLDPAKFQIHKGRENVKWNTIEYKKAEVIQLLWQTIFFFP